MKVKGAFCKLKNQLTSCGKVFPPSFSIAKRREVRVGIFQSVNKLNRSTMELNLKDKTAIVCGSTEGIGQAIAHELAGLGVNLTLIARNESKLKSVLRSLKQEGRQQHQYLVADFTYPEELEKVIAQYVNRTDRIDILVNNTGGPPPGKAIDASVEDFLSAFKQHLICSQVLVQAVVPVMKKNRYGRIINIISTSVKMPIPGLGVSNTIRGAVASWSKTLSLELGPFGITVNNVLPGSTKTGRLDSIISNKAQQSQKSIGDVQQEMMNEIPARRFGEPQELASAVAFLSSASAAYINGVSLTVDGGRTGCL